MILLIIVDFKCDTQDFTLGNKRDDAILVLTYYVKVVEKRQPIADEWRRRLRRTMRVSVSNVVAIDDPGIPHHSACWWRRRVSVFSFIFTVNLSS